LTFPDGKRIVKLMINQSADVDRLLHALADPTRRQIVERLGSGPASVTALAAPLPMSLPGVVQHLRVLEESGLIASQKVGRVRTCSLDLERLETVQAWITARRATWDRRLDRLGDVLTGDDVQDRSIRAAGTRQRRETRP
jgi:DNA-binding transcriptional ArsR family regulator